MAAIVAIALAFVALASRCSLADCYDSSGEMWENRNEMDERTCYNFIHFFDAQTTGVNRMLEYLMSECIANMNSGTGLYLLPDQLLLSVQPGPYTTDTLRAMLQLGGLRMDDILYAENFKLFNTLMTEILFFADGEKIKTNINVSEFRAFRSVSKRRCALSVKEVDILFFAGDRNLNGLLDFLEFHVMNTILLPELMAFKILAKLGDGVSVNPGVLREERKPSSDPRKNKGKNNMQTLSDINSRRIVEAFSILGKSFTKLHRYPTKPPTIAVTKYADEQPDNTPNLQFTFYNLRKGQFELLLTSINPENITTTINSEQFQKLNRHYELMLIFNKFDTNKDSRIDTNELLTATRYYRSTPEFGTLFRKWASTCESPFNKQWNIDFFTDLLLSLKVIEVYQQNDQNDDGLNETELRDAIRDLLLGDNMSPPITKSIEVVHGQGFIDLVRQSYAPVFIEQYRFLQMSFLFL